MKNRIIILLITLSVLFSLNSCKKDSYESEMFWSQQPGSYITVTVDGKYSGTITSYCSNCTVYFPPDCGSSGYYGLALPSGKHSYSAYDGTHTWDSTFTLTEDKSCNTILLYY